VKWRGVIKNLLRPGRDLILIVGGFAYDYYRFFKYGGWHKRDHERLNFFLVKIYHRIEKSLTFREQKLGAGIENAKALRAQLHDKNFEKNSLSFHEKTALKVLNDFALQYQGSAKDVGDIKEFCEKFLSHIPSHGGAKSYSQELLLAGKLENPEQFFLSRYSVRDFDSKKVDVDLIKRAINLALKTPSACNRQAWHVYHLSQRERIDQALSLQNGNRGFGRDVQCLLIIAADLRAFDTASERYQHWIDGGMFSMSLVLALHSLGLASCCLNWSKGPIDDIKLRKILKVQGSHSILMMLAVGYASDELKVCYSARRPIDEIYTSI